MTKAIEIVDFRMFVRPSYNYAKEKTIITVNIICDLVPDIMKLPVVGTFVKVFGIYTCST